MLSCGILTCPEIAEQMRHLLDGHNRSGSRLDLAIVGCGDVAGYTAGFARLNRGIRLIACCDISAERAAQFARRFHIARACTDYAELLSGGARPDALYLAVPHHLHRPMVEAALAAGIPVLVEKPLALTPGEGRQMVAAAEVQGIKLGVNSTVPVRRGLLCPGPRRPGRRTRGGPL